MVARSLGMKTKAELSPTQRKYAERIAQSLAEARFFVRDGRAGCSAVSRGGNACVSPCSEGLGSTNALAQGARPRRVPPKPLIAAPLALPPPPSHHLPLPTSSQKAAAMERKQAEEKKVMLAGQRLFEVGQYAASVELFEKALKEVGERTNLGGEARVSLRTGGWYSCVPGPGPLVGSSA